MKVTLYNGQVTHLPAVAAVPTSDGTEATKGLPAVFEVTFMIATEHDVDDRRMPNTFHWQTAIPNMPRDAAYRAIETAAAELLPGQLRQLADALEKEVAATNGT